MVLQFGFINVLACKTCLLILRKVGVSLMNTLLKPCKQRVIYGGKHYLPHDGAHERQGQVANLSPQKMLQKFRLEGCCYCSASTRVLPAINKTRDALMNDVWFDMDRCKKGLQHLENYTRKFNANAKHTQVSLLSQTDIQKASDAFRQFVMPRDYWSH